LVSPEPPEPGDGCPVSTSQPRQLDSRPLLDLDVNTKLVQNIKLAEALAIGSNDRVRMPRLALAGSERAEVEAIITKAMAERPVLPELENPKAA
jgi:dihydrodipicolinate synthase/N-acetylneuraminate lyase